MKAKEKARRTQREFRARRSKKAPSKLCVVYPLLLIETIFFHEGRYYFIIALRAICIYSCKINMQK